MWRKSEHALHASDDARSLILVTALFALVVASVTSVWMTARLLRPLSVLRLAVRRLGEGDLLARARVTGKDEIAGLASDFNAMAGHLEQYRKSSLGELLLAQSAAQAVIDSLPDPVVVVGLKGELVNANQAADQLLDVSVERTSVVSSLPAIVRPVVERLAAHVLGGNGPFVPRGMEEAIRVARPDGVYHLLPRATAVYSEEGAVNGVTVVLQDVTRLMRFDELKNNLVATVAHEFRTPLTSLRMALHMCVEGAVGDLTAKQLDMLTVARDDCERLQSIVDDLLDMARIQAGKIEVQPRRLSAEALVHEAVDAFQDAARQRNLTLRPAVLPGLGEVMADPDRLQLVFANLLTNAVRHTAAGEIVVRALPEGGVVRFEVADTGVGIPAEHQAAIFERFYRVPGADSGGAGLGLFIVKEIVEAHQGHVGFTSEAGKGTTFWFTIPLAPAEATAPTP
jgi:signal transduction histidine kinase